MWIKRNDVERLPFFASSSHDYLRISSKYGKCQCCAGVSRKAWRRAHIDNSKRKTLRTHRNGR